MASTLWPLTYQCHTCHRSGYGYHGYWHFSGPPPPDTLSSGAPLQGCRLQGIGQSTWLKEGQEVQCDFVMRRQRDNGRVRIGPLPSPAPSLTFSVQLPVCLTGRHVTHHVGCPSRGPRTVSCPQKLRSSSDAEDWPGWMKTFIILNKYQYYLKTNSKKMVSIV